MSASTRLKPSDDRARELLHRAKSGLSAVRGQRPRVHCLTNPVAFNLTANLLLATGAVPSMTATAEAMPDFIRSSDGLLINLGMLDGARRAAIEAALPATGELGRPWLLDPVKVDRSPVRLAYARRLLEHGPAVLRGNDAEMAALADAPETTGPTVLATTGAVDRVVQEGRHLAIANGSPLMDRVTAMGCAASALIVAFLVVEPDPFWAAAAALAAIGVAGEMAAERARGPGSFAVAFLDEMALLDEAGLKARLRLA